MQLYYNPAILPSQSRLTSSYSEIFTVIFESLKYQDPVQHTFLILVSAAAKKVICDYCCSENKYLGCTLCMETLLDFAPQIDK